MLHTARSRRGMVTASHSLAAGAGLSVLRDGGNAIEAMIAAASTISVVYPHMNGIGGDGFWLISEEGEPPLAIAGCGAAGGAVTPALYQDRGVDAIPSRGPLAAITTAGTVSSWQAALEVSADWGGSMPAARLLEDAIHYAESGFPLSDSQFENTRDKRDELIDVPGFADLFLADGSAPAPGTVFRNPALAASLKRLAEDGFETFYRGPLAEAIAADLARVGSPLTVEDLASHRADRVAPLAVRLDGATAYNHPPPTQGLASLIILGLFERLARPEPETFGHIHGIVEATKLAFRIRDDHVTDPAHMTVDPSDYLKPAELDRLAAMLDGETAASWSSAPMPGDTVWLGAIDERGRAVSFIHSIYWEFGSGVVLPETGIVWQNRGSSFSLEEGRQNFLMPGRKPFHTNNPAMAIFDDGRVMCYGSMGGEGQPQTQAAVFSRYALYGNGLQAAVTAPRWLFGRTWGQPNSRLLLESRIPVDVVDRLKSAGHDVHVADEFTALMGHAGALVRHPDGVIEGAADPRGDGAALGY